MKAEQLIEATRKTLAVCDHCGRTDCHFVIDENAGKLATILQLGGPKANTDVLYTLDP